MMNRVSWPWFAPRKPASGGEKRKLTLRDRVGSVCTARRSSGSGIPVQMQASVYGSKRSAA